MKQRKRSVRRCTTHPEEGSFLDGAPKGFSSLSLAYHLTEKASGVGFDWPNVKEILKKLDEEIVEFKEAISLKSRRRIEDEIGDLLFVIVNIARFLEIDPEAALMGSIEKFTSRFHYIERSLKREAKALSDSNLPEMDRLWKEAKKKGK